MTGRVPEDRAAPGSTRLARTGAPGSVARAMAVVALRGPAPWLVVLAVVATAACLLRWSAPTVAQAYALVLLPVGATVLAVLLWTQASQGWRAVATRECGAARPAVVVLALAVLGTLVVTVPVQVVLVVVDRGGGPAPAWVALTVTGATVAALSVALAARLGPSAALSVGAVGCVLGVLVGSNASMSRVFWWAVPWGWSVVVEPDRLVVVVVACGVLCAGSLLTTLAGARRATTEQG